MNFIIHLSLWHVDENARSITKAILKTHFVLTLSICSRLLLLLMAKSTRCKVRSIPLNSAMP